jgi:hypothetical protein
MLSHLPLDDELNELFYVDGGAWRLVWASALGRCELRREIPHVEFEQAEAMIVRGDLLWALPAHFERLDAGAALDKVYEEQVLVSAFLRSPAGQRLTQWTMRQRLDLRLREIAEWVAKRTLTRDDVHFEDGE